MLEIINVEQMKVFVNEAFYQTVSEEWEKILHSDFGDPALQIDVIKENDSVMVTVTIVFQKSVRLYRFHRMGEVEQLVSFFLTKKQAQWIGSKTAENKDVSFFEKLTINLIKFCAPYRYMPILEKINYKPIE